MLSIYLTYAKPLNGSVVHALKIQRKKYKITLAYYFNEL